MKNIVFLLAAVGILSSCSTDLDINAPYKNITVVYGLLNQRDSIQYIKINKAYLGEGDALLFAQIADSNQWADADITVAQVHRVQNGTRMGTFQLEPTIFTNREPGVFYSPDQKLYKFVDPEIYDSLSINGDRIKVYLDQESTYELELVVKGETISATTTIIDDFSFQGADQNPDVPINLRSSNSYQNWALNWTSGRDGKRYEVSYRFNYREFRGSDSSDVLSITRPMGRSISSNTGSTEPMERTLESELFYSSLSGNITSDPTVTKRKFVSLDLLVAVANDEFHTYLSLTEPVSGIIEDRPTYSNIVNGVGLFGSRYNRDIIGKELNGISLNELISGQYTAQLLFCLPGSQSCP